MYQQISHFGNSSNGFSVSNNDPLTYCIDGGIGFNHGGYAAASYGQNSSICQTYLAQRCAQNWDNVCEYLYNKPNYNTQSVQYMNVGGGQSLGLSPGDILLKNTAQEKYRINMLNCTLKQEQFDPLDPSSPYISYYVGQNCIPQYSVDPNTIDQDNVMHKILDRPFIATQLLTNIKNTMMANGTFQNLRGTRLGFFYGLV